jgi:7-carboxy-7-deazaguanine synthase
MTLIINEIFHSIQGESTFAGRACVFVRLTGCNLRCTYCDTRYAYAEGRPLTIDQVVEKVAAFDCNLVEITGGEPLLQANTGQLVKTLLAQGYQVLMETNGSLDISVIDPVCIKIIDMKCPDSGEADQCDFANLQRMSTADQVKFVISSRQDYLYAKKALPRIPDKLECGNVLFSPVWDRLPGKKLAQWILEDGLNVRLQMQMHKILWPDIERGV